MSNMPSGPVPEDAAHPSRMGRATTGKAFDTSNALERMRHKMADDNPNAALLIGAGIGLAIAATIFIAWLFVDPAPPNTIRIATGSEGGYYAKLGDMYRDRLEASGLRVSLVPSKGSMDNIDHLSEGRADVAFIQGGVLPENPPEMLQSLASVALEPLWIFTRGEEPVRRLSELEGRRVSVGPEGSGTRALSLNLLEATGMEDRVIITDEGRMAAVKALMDGGLDGALFVTSASTGSIRDLLMSPSIHLAQLERADGFAMRFPYLSVVTIPEGGFDLSLNVPEAPTRLLAPATTLLVRDDVHPALVALVLDVANVIHGAESQVGTNVKFPSQEFLELPLNEEARRYFENGPTFLRRYMPFWAANLVERLWVLIIPLVTVMIPLMRVAPPAYRWQIRRRIYRWYDDLRELEELGRKADTDEERREIVAALDALEADVGAIRVPLSYTDNLYHLRLHIEFARRMVDPTQGPDLLSSPA